MRFESEKVNLQCTLHRVKLRLSQKIFKGQKYLLVNHVYHKVKPVKFNLQVRDTSSLNADATDPFFSTNAGSVFCFFGSDP